MKKLFPATLLFLVAGSLATSEPVAQDASPGLEATGYKAKVRDESNLRRELEAQYAKLVKAIGDKDYDAFMALRTPDFSTRPLTGQPQNAEQMAARARLLLQVIQQPIDVSFEILDLNVKGDTAVVTIRQRFSRMQQVEGQLRKLETGVTQNETWVKTPGGWKLKFVENECDLVRIVDGKSVDPARHYGVDTPPCKVGGAVQTGSQQTQQIGRAEQEVRRLERAWLDAYERRDVEAMNRIVADDFIITFPTGDMQTKAQIISSLKRSPAGGVSHKFYTEGVRSRAYGDTVVLTGRVIAEWEQGGKKVREESRYTDTYVQQQGRWQVVASHLSNVPRP